MYCKYQRLVFRRRGVLPADRMNEAPKVQMPRWNATISHTQQQTAAVIPFCTAITMQYQ